MEINTENELVCYENISVPPYSSKNVTINQALTQTGDWSITVGNQSYAFVTLTNRIDAKLQINALNDIQANKESTDRSIELSNQSNTLASQSNIISALSLLTSFGAFVIAIIGYRKKS